MAAHPPFLDRPIARWLAVLCFLLSVGVLAFMHRNDLLGRASQAPAGDDLLAQCVAARGAQVEQMLKEGLVSQEQADRVRNQLEPVCRAQLKLE